MKMLHRNDKVNQRLELEEFREAQQTLAELHRLLAQPGKAGLSVGEMVNVAARMGMLRRKPEPVR